jgi:hypothetical protein
MVALFPRVSCCPLRKPKAKAGGGQVVASDQADKAYNDHNMYILGAGFAVEAGPAADQRLHESDARRSGMAGGPRRSRA